MSRYDPSRERQKLSHSCLSGAAGLAHDRNRALVEALDDLAGAAEHNAKAVRSGCPIRAATLDTMAREARAAIAKSKGGDVMSARCKFWEEVERYTLNRFNTEEKVLAEMRQRINEAALLLALERIREAEYTVDRR